MEDNDKILVQDLTDSFLTQYRWYCDLHVMVRTILSRLVLSRGDIGSVGGFFEKKKNLLDKIDDERNRIADMIARFQEKKEEIKHRREAAELFSVLDKTELVIREFIAAEDQLRDYLAKILKKKTPGPT